jgi:hypothetical protein
MKRRISLVPVAAFILFFMLLNIYVLSGIRTLSNSTATPLLFWTVVLLITAALISSFRRIESKGMDNFFKVSTHAFLILLVSELVFAIILVPADVYRIFSGTVRNIYWVDFASAMFMLTVLLFVFGVSMLTGLSNTCSATQTFHKPLTVLQ